MKTFRKQPNEIRDVDVEFADYFNGLGGDSINFASCTVAITSGNTGGGGDLLLGPGALPDMNQVSTSRLKVWLGAGVTGTTYKITVTMVASSGRKLEVDFRMRVAEV